ncbi:ABC transporter substrate-binding protein [Desulfovermiculus halophilus]|uniref:ABC transporter substrate-binding protein n=1 Tax=Desulfovermiculus halophilus TaxID=339722 RepID=UPI0006865199|nr:ABC transporter substrate-binding protein [Desulfovermiculus halophilus]
MIRRSLFVKDSLCRPVTVFLLGLALLMLAAMPAQAENLKFGVPAWPGLTVKTEVAAQLLESLGYSTKQYTSSPSVILKSLENKDMDIYLGGWIPQETEMINPLAEKGTVIKVVKNLPDCMIGMAVPTYVWDQGVHSMADLDSHADKFESKLYGIEAGSGINKEIKEVIAQDGDGLGDWTLVESSAAGMLSQLDRATRRKDWMVFFAWEPHWMGTVYDFKYLKDTDESGTIAYQKSWVWTVVRSDLPETHPNVYRFLQQFVLTSDIQSEWIYEFKREDKEPEQVATKWIAEHMDMIGTWLEGVETADGKPATPVVQKAFR